jgi:hypothetical protein
LQLTKKDQIRLKAESDLEAFINLVHPQRVLGSIHQELIRWWTREDAKQHQLVLLPRDHQKSALVAYRVAWWITKNPTVRVLYISSTANLSNKQLKFIKDILTCDNYRFYWPEMVNIDEAKREKWTETEISVDHPARKKEAVRDPTVFTAGLTTNIVGLHCDIAVLDDVVVGDNAYTEDGRSRTRTQASYLASIAGTDSSIWVVGTRYHPKDLYNDFLEMTWDVYNEHGEAIDSPALYEVFERQVESQGDGTGQFLWPRQQRSDGRWFGVDQVELSKKKAQYLDKTQFRAQYYNNPNDIENATIQSDCFQYYEPKLLNRESGKWFFKQHRLNVFAAVDFAFSLAHRADYTAIVVVGCDTQNNYYVLDIDRFQTNKISEYFTRILRLHQKWDFRKIRAEVTAAQDVIVKDLKESYIRPHGLALSIDEFRPTRNEGTKIERVEAILQPRYNNRQIWHYRGGNCQTLEEELILSKPPHDDIKDSLASCIEICIPPSAGIQYTRTKEEMNEFFHPRFGGVSH